MRALVRSDVAVPKQLGIVAIGRNEGERLRRCLESVSVLSSHVIYVDSGSCDDSTAIGRTLAAQVVELDMNTPFTAARARNAGFEQLIALHPQLRYVFFVDGDCEVAPDWLSKAASFLDEHPDMAVAWGNRVERFPQQSIYNMLCDMEWRDHPIGESPACGGDAVIRVQAFRQVSGYRADLICGEEPEMCVRLRQLGWRIWHLDEAMTLHDASMLRFGQWWRRTLRGGYAFAQGAALHGASPQRHWIVESKRAWIWGLAIPVATLLMLAVTGWWGLLVLMLYPVQILRLALRGRRTRRENWWRAVALVLGKFPEMLGQVRFLADRYRGSHSQLIEYK